MYAQLRLVPDLPYNITVFKDLTPCDLVAGHERLIDAECLRYTVEAVKMEAADFYETVVLICQATRLHLPQDRIHDRGHIKSHFWFGQTVPAMNGIHRLPDCAPLD
jgi:hypothetical protein